MSLTPQEQQLLSRLIARVNRLESRLKVQEATEQAAGTMTTEQVQDAAFAALTDTATIDFTYNDALNQVTADVKSASISNSLLANMATTTVKGQTVGGSGAPVDLTAAQLTTIIETATLYLLLAGRSGGQTAKGDTASGGNLTLMSTAHATKGKILFGTSGYDEVNNRLGIRTSSPASAVEVLDTGTASTRGFTITQTNSGAQGSQLNFNKSRGSRGSEATVADGDFGFVLNALFHDGSAYQNFGRIAAKVNGSVSAGNVPVDMTFSTGVTALVEVMRILSSGVITTGGLTSAGASQLAIKAGTSSNDAAVGGVLYVDSGTHGSTSSEVDLATYTVPANTLHGDNQSLEFHAWGTFAANGDTKTLKVNFGASSTTIYNAALNNGTWSIRGRIIRTGAATQIGIYEASDTLSTTPTIKLATPTETLSGSSVLRLRGQGSTINDIIQNGFMVWWHDANT